MTKKNLVLLLPLLVFSVLAVFLYTNLGKDNQYIKSQLINKPLPNFQAQDLHTGRSITAADFKGPALINVWASWCPACAAEHKMLLSLKQQGVTIYGINYKDEQQDALQFIEALGNPFALSAIDKEGHIGFDLGVYGAPETFFINANGVVTYRHVGEIYPSVWADTLKPIYEAL